MGCDIHSHAERKNAYGQWEKVPDLQPFSARNYGTFGFLAGVRNYSDLTPISLPRGVPTDVSLEVLEDYEGWGSDAHSASWLSVAELAAFDYEAQCEDCRVTRKVRPNAWNGGCTCKPGEGRQRTYREFLERWFFDDLQKLQEAGAERVVFWFDN